jgi:hypothetical protein
MGSGGSLSLTASRGFVVAANSLTVLAGLVLILIGLYGWLAPNIRLYSDGLPFATIAIGVFVFLISIIGCCGAVWEHKPTLLVYFTILMVLVIVQLIAAIVTLADTRNIDFLLDTAWQNAYDRHPKIIREIEDKYECCGFRTTTDRAVPKFPKDACTKSEWFGYETPCFDSLYESYRDHQRTVGIWGIVLALIQIFALLFAYILIKYLPSSDQRERQYLSDHDRLVQQGRGRGDAYGSNS